MITKETVEHLAKLAKLAVSEESKQKYSEQLSAIISYFAQLNEVPTHDVPVTSQVTGLTNVSRSDEQRILFNAEKVLAAAPEVAKQHIKVDAVFEE